MINGKTESRAGGTVKLGNTEGWTILNQRLQQHNFAKEVARAFDHAHKNSSIFNFRFLTFAGASNYKGLSLS